MLAALLNFVSIYLISTLSGIEVYGGFAMVVAITTLVPNIMKFGLDSHIMKYCPPLVERYGPNIALSYLTENAKVMAGSFLGTVLLTLTFATFFFGIITFSVQALLTTFAATCLLLKLLIATFLRSQGVVLWSQYFLRLSDILIFVLFLICTWGSGILLDLSLIQLIVFWALAISLNFLLSFGFLTYKISRNSSVINLDVSSQNNLKVKVSELSHFSGINCVAALMQNMDVLLIGYFSGDANAGIFSILKRSANQIFLLVGVLQTQYWSELSIASDKRHQDLIHSIVKKARRVIITALLPLCVTSVCIVYVLLKLADVEITFVVLTCFGALMLAMIINALFLFSATLANLNGLERFLFYIMAVCAILYLATVGIALGDILTASFAFLIYQVVLNTAVATRLFITKRINLLHR